MYCNIEIDECSSNPCLNDGSCSDDINSFTCDCFDTGYTGAVCDTSVDECESDPCLNGGVCVDDINEYTCNCTSTGYEGWYVNVELFYESETYVNDINVFNYVEWGYKYNTEDSGYRLEYKSNVYTY